MKPSMEDVLAGVDAARRAGWARAFAAERELASLKGVLHGLIDSMHDASRGHPQSFSAVADAAWTHLLVPILNDTVHSERFEDDYSRGVRVGRAAVTEGLPVKTVGG